ncbi:MAG: hypothetical protein FWD02_02020 [Bacteroidales bacterium]|nr:hypothetical protein [Bacteroidales bacterium]
MQKFSIILILSLVSLALFGQVKPSWTNASMREINFPSNVFFTGYTQGTAHRGESIAEATQRLSRDAQGLLVESIRVRVESATTSQTISTQINQNERLTSEFISEVRTTTTAEVVGMNTETFHDRETGLIHAFAFVNRFELIGFYRANLSMNLTQIEGLLNTVQNLETNGEKARARQQLETAIPLIEQVRYAQSLLIAIDQNSSPENLQLQRTEQLQNSFIQQQARLAQAVYVFVESSENLFGANVNIVSSRVKAELSQMGCSFTDDILRADWRLTITVTTRIHGETHGFLVSYADVQINLFDVRRNRSVFQDEFSQRGIAPTQEQSARRALSDVVPIIVERISPWF